MTINIIAAGKLKEQFFCDALAEYKKRLSRFLTLNIIETPDFAGDKTSVLRREAEAMLPKLKGTIITLEIGGENLTSEEFSTKLDKLFLTSSELTFVIGGSHGLDAQILAKSAYALSFGKMTFPHQLMRVMLAEQLYRAICIKNNTPYHK